MKEVEGYRVCWSFYIKVIIIIIGKSWKLLLFFNIS